ncbi:MarR family winged helix-turn-helix transcriptional regulator [uncultured Arthrobacter sp.]|uniref:MarR family winged helix-turn-helix transcriptional regulator n=1 Tax=uncultured Arthrobacter sp. TaxID=114050 RepID=UPI00262D645C|nr:helix-turn-helix domain-containing protein [uncultured Arthrobacter sp.]
MATAPDPSTQTTPVSDADLTSSTAFSGTTALNDDGTPVETHSTRLMLTTAAHFVQEHLHSQLADLGLTPLDLSVLSGLVELPGAATSEIATQCLLPDSATERSLAELTQLGFVEIKDDTHSLTAAGSRALEQARALEDALFTEKGTTLRIELSSLISRLRDSGVLDPK